MPIFQGRIDKTLFVASLATVSQSALGQARPTVT